VNPHAIQVVLAGFSSQLILIKVPIFACFFFVKETHDLEDFVGLTPEVVTMRNGTCS
jgi:hypothetical protein